MIVKRQHVKYPWFPKIKDGSKKIEGKSGPLDKFDGFVGNFVVFYNDDKEFTTKITRINHYSTISTFLEVEGIENVLPGITSNYEAVLIYLRFAVNESKIEEFENDREKLLEFADKVFRDLGGMNALYLEIV
mgnify:CR=1 FL=1